MEIKLIPSIRREKSEDAIAKTHLGNADAVDQPSAEHAMANQPLVDLTGIDLGKFGGISVQ